MNVLFDSCSVHLARRVLQLERANTSLRNEVNREAKKKEQLAEEVGQTLALYLSNNFMSTVDSYHSYQVVSNL